MIAARKSSCGDSGEPHGDTPDMDMARNGIRCDVFDVEMACREGILRAP